MEPAPKTSVILLVDDDLERRAALASSLLGATATSSFQGLAISCRELLAITSSVAAEVIISILGPERRIAPEVLDVLNHVPGAAGVFLGVNALHDIHGPLPAGRERLRAGGVGLGPALAELLASLLSPRVSAPFSPAEYVQLAGLGGHSVTLHCVGERGQLLGAIAMQGGQVHAAWHGAQRGFEAFAALVTRSDTRVIVDRATSEQPDDDLSEHWQVLVLEAMRRYDERERKRSISARPRSTARPHAPKSSSEKHPVSERSSLARAASIPVLPVTEMKETLGSTRGIASPDARALVEEGVRAVIEHDYARAISRFEQALVSDPKNASIRHRLTRLRAIVSGEG